MKFNINANGHKVNAGGHDEEVSEKDFWAMLKRQVAAMPHNR